MFLVSVTMEAVHRGTPDLHEEGKGFPGPRGAERVRSLRTKIPTHLLNPTVRIRPPARSLL